MSSTLALILGVAENWKGTLFINDFDILNHSICISLLKSGDNLFCCFVWQSIIVEDLYRNNFL